MKKRDQKTEDTKPIEIPVSKDLQVNIKKIKEILIDCDDVIIREFSVGKRQNYKYALVYIDGLIDKQLINEYVMEALMHDGRDEVPNPRTVGSNLYKLSKEGGIPLSEVKDLNCLKTAVDSVLAGETILLFDGFSEILLTSSRGWPMRGIAEPVTEAVNRGPRDGFTETGKVNTSLVRRRIRDPKLKLKYQQIGRRSKTDVALMYIDDIVDKGVLKLVKERLDGIDVDAVLESSYIEQLIEDDWISPFPQIQDTERPDAVAASLYEGRVALIIDNTPFALLMPATFNSLLQSSEDYYSRWAGAFVVRLIRTIALPLALLLPSLYIAITSYHPGMLPTQLALYIAATRMDVPFPSFIEAFIMEATLEILREAGTRISGPVGTTIGIVGGLVIGQAAVEAGIVSPFMIIVVALTTISSFTLPNFSLTSGIRIWRFLLMILAAILGLYGIGIGLMLLLAHLVSLKSFGVPYFEPYSNFINDFSDLKDSIVRLPYKFMKLRPKYLRVGDKVRMNNSKDINSLVDESGGENKDDRGQ